MIKYRTSPFTDIPGLSYFDRTYATQPEKLEAFYKYKPELSQFRQVIKDKSKEGVDRALLVEVFTNQYEALGGAKPHELELISSLRSDKTFTVITAHQPSLMSGPSYFIYKIISAIKLAEMIQQENPDFHIVPIFILGGEDHDIEEVNHLNLYEDCITWSNKQGGAVGRYSLEGMDQVISEFKKYFGENPRSLELYNKVIEPFRNFDTYGQATRQMVRNLFEDQSLLTLSMDDPLLKPKMVDIFRDDLFEHSSQSIVQKTQRDLESAGFGNQAHVRPINLFYLEENSRQRIERNGDHFFLVDSGRQFSEEEILEELNNNPEKFSPNVVLRPLFQEKIFPNLAYVGGGGELAYWMERKHQFEFYKINFPMLVRRDSAHWINHKSINLISKLGLEWNDVFCAKNDLVGRLIHDQSLIDLGEESREKLSEVFQGLKSKTQGIDPTLVPMLGANERKIEKIFDSIVKKSNRAIKRKNGEKLGQIEKLLAQNFPKGKLQERYLHFSENYFEFGPEEFFKNMYEHFNPLDFQFKIFYPQKA